MRWTWRCFRRTALKRTAKSCGPDAPTLASSSWEASFSGMTVAKQPVTGESTKETVKPLRREGRSVSAEPVCSCAHFLCILHTRPRVQRAPGFPCALYSARARKIHKPRAQRVARTRRCDLRHCERKRSNPFHHTERMDCFVASAPRKKRIDGLELEQVRRPPRLVEVGR
jgi:hypothetical protein